MKGVVFCDKFGIVICVAVFAEMGTGIVSADIVCGQAEAVLTEQGNSDFWKKMDSRGLFDSFP